MHGTRMVPVLRATDGFHARVVAARLGSEGMITSFRGGGLDGPYPMGAVEVLVQEADLDDARELLLADEVESAFSAEGEAEPVADVGSPSGPRWAPWVLATLVVGLLVLSLVL